MTDLQWPGLPPSNPVYANYTERLEVGYRWYTAHSSQPRFCFGHGLSYTTFAYSGMSVSRTGDHSFNVTFNIANTGKVDGAEVPQMYLRFPSAAGEPPAQLKGFTKVGGSVGYGLSHPCAAVAVPRSRCALCHIGHDGRPAH